MTVSDEMCPSVRLEPPTYGLAPWNIARFTLAGSDAGLRTASGPIHFYHFHGIRWLDSDLASDRLWHYHVTPDEVILQEIYGPYLFELAGLEVQVTSELGFPKPLCESSIQGPLWWRMWQARTICRLNRQTGRIERADYSCWHPTDRLRTKLRRWLRPTPLDHRDD